MIHRMACSHSFSSLEDGGGREGWRGSSMFSLSQRRLEKGFQLLSMVVHCSVFSLTEDAEKMFSVSLRKLNQFANLRAA